jgi:formylglycine-generating enzyme required for sulfatase activity
MTAVEMHAQLAGMLRAEFEIIRLRLDVPSNLLSEGVPQATRALELIQYLQSRNEEARLQQLLATRRTIRRTARSAFLVVVVLAAVAVVGWVASPLPTSERGPEVAAAPPAGMKPVRGGTFLMGLDENARPGIAAACREAGNDEARCKNQLDAESPARWTRVHAFFLDIHEVTNREYVEWLKRQPRSPDRVDLKHSVIVERDGAYAAPESEWDKPVVGVPWTAARELCAGRRARLPSEAEWEIAARGVDGAEYPWGESQVNCDQATYGRNRGPCSPGRADSPTAVGTSSFDKRDGIFDLGGNVSEWVEDTYAHHDFNACTHIGRWWAPGKQICVDPVRRSNNPGERVVRGGSWADPNAFWLRAAVRHPSAQSATGANLGFRCAADVKEGS